MKLVSAKMNGIVGELVVNNVCQPDVRLVEVNNV